MDGKKTPKFTYEELSEKYIDGKEESSFTKAKDITKDYNLVVTFIISILLYIGIGVFVGNYLDNLLNTKPLFILLFTFLGIGAAYRNLYVLIKKHDNKGSTNNEKKR